jgi:hypothetical protein
MTEEREQGTPQQDLGGEAEPSKDTDQEAQEETGYDSPAGKERQDEEDVDSR